MSSAACHVSFLTRLGNRGRSMWSPHCVYLAPAVGERSGDSARRGVVDHAQALLIWRAWCEQNPASRCRLYLSGHWLLGCASSSLEDAVRQWHHYLDLEPEVLQREWLLRHAQGLASAVPRELMDDLIAVAARHQVKVTWAGPWWVERVHAWLKRLPEHGGELRLVMVEAGMTVHFTAHDGRLVRMWSLPVDGCSYERGSDERESVQILDAGPAMLTASLRDDLDTATKRRSDAWYRRWRR